jgi:RNA polymerase sigma-70 factor (ECF subfamily)
LHGARDLGDADLARRITAAAPAVAEAEEDELCRRYARRVYLYGLRHLRAEDRARDLAQDVMVLTLEKLRAGQVRDPERIGSFVLGAARLMSRSTARSDAREAALETVPHRALRIEPAASDPLARDRVVRCLEALGERQRTVVVLTYYADEPTDAIASALGLTANNVRVIRHRGLRHLRSCLGLAASPTAA